MEEEKKEGATSQEADAPQSQSHLNKPEERRSNTCILQMDEIPHFEIKSTQINQTIQYMQDHALICKFMGLWPSEKALVWWIKTHWKPKGDLELKLGSKGLFIVIFNQTEDRKRIF
jgi:hypothetical protein